jgi:hypothetical protein
MSPRDSVSAGSPSPIAVPIGRYVFDFGSREEGSFALYEPSGETTNARAVADALATQEEVQAGEPTLDEFVEDASTVTAWCERCVRLFNDIAAGKALDPKVVSAEIDELLGLLGRLDRAGRHKEALRLARDLAALLALFLRWVELVQSLELALRTAKELGDGEAEAWGLHELGSLHLGAGEPAAASKQLEEALQLREKASGYGRCATRHNLDAARRDFAEVDALSRAHRRRLFRLVGGGAVLALLAGGGVALGVATGGFPPTHKVAATTGEATTAHVTGTTSSTSTSGSTSNSTATGNTAKTTLTGNTSGTTAATTSSGSTTPPRTRRLL